MHRKRMQLVRRGFVAVLFGALAWLACEEPPIVWHWTVAPSGARLAWPDAPVPQEVVDAWPAAVDAAVAHLLRYQLVTEADVRRWLELCRVYVRPGPWEYERGKWAAGRAYPEYLVLEVAWELPSHADPAPALGHEVGHIHYTRTLDAKRGELFEHSWWPPLVSALAAAFGEKPYAEDCAGCGGRR